MCNVPILAMTRIMPRRQYALRPIECEGMWWQCFDVAKRRSLPTDRLFRGVNIEVKQPEELALAHEPDIADVGFTRGVGLRAPEGVAYS